MALINTTTTGVLGSTFFGDGTGPLTVQQNGVTLGTYGNIPAFRAYMSSAQTLSNATLTKLNFNSVLHDTNSNYNTTNYRFTPTVAGFYFTGTNIYTSATAQVYIYKNGISELTGYYAAGVGQSVSGLVYMNGTTDYLESWYFGGAITTANNAYNNTIFYAFLVKAM